MNISNVGIIEYPRILLRIALDLADLVANIVLDGASLLVKMVSSLINTFIVTIRDILNKTINIPILSDIFKSMTINERNPTGEDITALNISALIVAIPAKFIISACKIAIPTVGQSSFKKTTVGAIAGIISGICNFIIGIIKTAEYLAKSNKGGSRNAGSRVVPQDEIPHNREGILNDLVNSMTSDNHKKIITFLKISTDLIGVFFLVAPNGSLYGLIVLGVSTPKMSDNKKEYHVALFVSAVISGFFRILGWYVANNNNRTYNFISLLLGGICSILISAFAWTIFSNLEDDESRTVSVSTAVAPLAELALDIASNFKEKRVIGAAGALYMLTSVAYASGSVIDGS